MPPIESEPAPVYQPPKKSKKLLIAILVSVGVVIVIATLIVVVLALTRNHDKQTTTQVAESTIPQKVIASYASTNQIILSWSKASGATAYAIQCATTNTFDSPISSVTTSTNGSCSGLQPSTTYYIRVKGTSTTYESNWSSIITGKTLAVVATPTNLKLVANADGTVAYSWTAVKGATSYDIQWATDTNFLQNTTNITTSQTSGVSAGLTTKTTYYYRVRVTPAAGSIIPYSAAQSVTIK